MKTPSTDVSASPSRPATVPHMTARGLGWFSIGLGLAEFLMPRTMARVVGMPGRSTLLRVYGLREIATGIGILTSRDPSPWLWGRVAGDAVDAATLAAHATPDNPRAGHALAAIAAVGGVAAVDITCARALQAQTRRAATPMGDYRSRSGFPEAPDAMRGRAMHNGHDPVPNDMRTPQPMRPYPLH
jgi:hypothetical protein